MDRTYIAIDLKSFFASAECAARGLDPLRTNLVVADIRRTEKTICLAVTPSLKEQGVPGRPRLFEVIQRVRDINALRAQKAPGGTFTGTSADAAELAQHPEYELDFIIAPPRISYYIRKSTEIYGIYLKYIAPEDIHVYSIDEVFIDATDYLKACGLSGRELAMKIIIDILHTTGITATAGIGTNLYLCKVAMDIQAKHIPADQNGVRIAELDEMSYRRLLWSHRPLTDFWRVGRGTARRLEQYGMYTMGDVARCSMGTKKDFLNEDLLYELFGVNAELLIDHAWGWEPCTIADIKAYRPGSSSLSSGQVLAEPYDFDKARLIVREMADSMSLELVEKGLLTDQIVLTVGYDSKSSGSGEVHTDRYGRKVPKSAHGSLNLGAYTSSTKKIMDSAAQLYDQIVNPRFLVRRMYFVVNHVISRAAASERTAGEQMSIFTDDEERRAQQEAEAAELARERKMQKAMLSIKKRFGGNAILRGADLQEGATMRQRNRQIGGHQAAAGPGDVRSGDLRASELGKGCEIPSEEKIKTGRKARGKG